MQNVPVEVPALYLGRTELIIEAEVPQGYSPLFRRPPSFANALVQSIGGGNTMVFSHEGESASYTAQKNLRTKVESLLKSQTFERFLEAGRRKVDRIVVAHYLDSGNGP